MLLYKIEVALAGQTVYLIVAANSDAAAFDCAEGHLVRHFVKRPDVREMAIVEKKRIEQGCGYVIEGPCTSRN